ncbi:GNAT family N-acetyltransferase [Pannus brasiliensis CCIBt3594]|uniref:GNAT family N-acetyltransferase n=1 Tax=Pannus brasiliensis CCIBt3594 TaxID=1427578 RepID=A0AAW9QTY2_9CHRO
MDGDAPDLSLSRTITIEPDLIIRNALPGDRSILVGFREALQDSEREYHPNRPPGVEIGDAHLAYLEELALERDGRIYVAGSAGDILGFLVCFIERLDAGDLHVYDREREYGYISDLYVSPRSRGRGIGTALMEAAESHFRGRGLSVIRVNTLADNRAAIEFYRAIDYGFYEITLEKRLEEK